MYLSASSWKVARYRTGKLMIPTMNMLKHTKNIMR